MLVVDKFFPGVDSNSWQKSISNLFLLQNRLFKAFSLSDLNKCLLLQKLILKSNSSRLLAIREVTQLSSYKKIPGVDGKVFLTFTERFELNEYLRLNYTNWFSHPVKIVSVLKNDGGLKILKLPVIADRVWQLVVFYSLEPIYEGLFHPHNFGFRTSYSIFDLQKFFTMNFSDSSNADQKRVLIFDFERIFCNFNFHPFLETLFAPRGIKLGLFRSFNNGFDIGFLDSNDKTSLLGSLFANILLNGIDNIHCSARFGYKAVFILKPFDDEKIVFRKVFSYLQLKTLSTNFNVIGPLSLLAGFQFLDWDYVFLLGKGLVIMPNFNNYQQFLFRVKRILNNSNYGSNIKAAKLAPIVREWKVYNKFCCSESSRLSLFYLKKKAFKIFNKESKQDSYSAKKLLDKVFSNNLKSEKCFFEIDIEKSPYYGHFVFNFCFKNTFFTKKSYSVKFEKLLFFDSFSFCIHCGLKCSFIV